MKIRRWYVNLLIIFVILYALFVGGLLIVPPHHSFLSIVVSKPAGTWGWFDNGAVIWNTPLIGRKTNVAIIISIPIPVKLNDTNFIAVAYTPETASSILRVGDVVNVRGVILRATANKLTVNFIHASDIVKTGIMPVTDPVFNSIIQVIQQEEQTQNNLLWAGDVGAISTGDWGDSGDEGDGGGDSGD